MDRYLLSIIIPTKNRQYYCLNSVKQILGCFGNEVEIVVQDNSDEPSLKEQIIGLGKDNIVYNYKSGVVSFVDNFDMAIQHASGKYLMLIGDDDGVTSLAMKVVNWADKNEIDSVKPALSFVYFWPGSKVFQENDNGILDIYSFGGKIKDYNPKDGIKKLLENGCQNYLEMSLIKLYHGIVRKDLLESIRERTGKYVGGLSPDIYLSVALSLTSRSRAVELDVPVTISGICTGSGSSQSATGEHTGNLEDAPHFRGHETYEWDNHIPRFYSAETIWGDSALAAVKDIAPEYLQFFDIKTLAYRCLRKYPKYKKAVWECFSANKGSYINLFGYAASRVIHKGISLLKKKDQNGAIVHKNEIVTITDASVICESWINSHDEAIAFEEYDFSN